MKIPARLREMMAGDPVVLVATSDREGTPHLALAKGLQWKGDERLVFEDWFCFQTLRNILQNPRISLALVDPRGERGHQILGTVEISEPTEMMDGYGPDEEQAHRSIPQAKTQFQIRVETILELSTGLHTDEP